MENNSGIKNIKRTEEEERRHKMALNFSKAFIVLIIITLAIAIFYSYSKKPTPIVDELKGDIAKIHFIDVGQGDSILIESSAGRAVLVDGGTRSSAAKLVAYLKKQGISKLYAVVATHPHEDHIGGLVRVVNEFSIEHFYMPKKEHTTQTFENLIKGVIQSGARRIQARAGVEFKLDDLEFSFVAPNSNDYKNVNDFSAVIKVTHGENSVLLTGDAQWVSEEEMVKNKRDIKGNILKVGHHGSSTSTTEGFLQAVAPSVAVISLGADNTYGHPHREVVEILNAYGVTIHRTDQRGTIIAESDGENIRLIFEK